MLGGTEPQEEAEEEPYDYFEDQDEAEMIALNAIAPWKVQRVMSDSQERPCNSISLPWPHLVRLKERARVKDGKGKGKGKLIRSNLSLEQRREQHVQVPRSEGIDWEVEAGGSGVVRERQPGGRWRVSPRFVRPRRRRPHAYA